MANPFNTIFRPLVRGFGEAASRAKPFYSGVDQAISAITQNKGTGQQMLAEILKTKGAAKELKDRPVVRAALNQPKITKEQLQKIATDNPAPQFTEKTRGESGFEAEADKRVAEMKRFRVNEIMDEMNPDSLPQSAEQWKAARLSAENVVQDEEKQIRQNVVEVLHNEGSFYPKFGELTIPGGTNYREILFQLPRIVPEQEFLSITQMKKFLKDNQRTDLEGMNDIEKFNFLNKERRKAGEQPKSFQSPHYPDSNILAHARVSDRFEANGDKALHIEELQSDLHQEGRKRGYIKEKGVLPEGWSVHEGLDRNNNKHFYVIDNNNTQVGLYGNTKEEAVNSATERNGFTGGVPDAPFKSNWHELVMKRLLDDAVKNGYKKVYITPGAEQAKRYNLSKYISKIEYEPTEQAGRYEIVAYGKKGEVVYHEDMVNLRRIEELVGKDMARKIENDEGTLSSPNSGYRDWREFSGLELKSGGEGMLGFYDKMVPSFVNDYGAPHNMRMNLHDTQVGGNKYTVFEDSNPSPFSVVREGGSAIASRHGTREEAEAAVAELSTQPLHSIAITPEFEKHVQEKGQRLYQAIPAGIGAGIGAEALTEEEPAPMKKGGPVSLDAMRLAVMNKKVQHKQYGGALRSGISRIRKNMNPVRGNTIIKEGGGNWMAGDVERGLKGLKSSFNPRLDLTWILPDGFSVAPNTPGSVPKTAERLAQDAARQQPPNEVALNQFVDKQLTRYVKNQMGTKDDPIRSLAEKGALHVNHEQLNFWPEMHGKYLQEGQSAVAQSPVAKSWEGVSDMQIQPTTAGALLGKTDKDAFGKDTVRDTTNMLADNPWLNKVPADASVYGLAEPRHLADNLKFDHLIDELRNATNPASGLPRELLLKPESLSKLSVPQAVERVAKINEWRAAQMETARKAAREGIPVHKEYLEGYQWTSAPDTAADEKALQYIKDVGCEGGWCTQGESAAKQYGGGNNRLYVLHDPQGKAVTQISVNTTENFHPISTYGGQFGEFPTELNYGGWGGVPKMTKEKEKQIHELGKKLYDQKGLGWFNAGDASDSFQEAANMLIGKLPAKSSIKEIKGKGNAAPREEHLPYVQDFVKSQPWSDVQDLHHTGLVRKSDYIYEFTSDQLDSTGAGEYITTKEIDAYRNKLNEDLINKFAKHRIKPDPESQDTLGRTDFMTVKELAELSFPDSLKRQADMIRGALQGTTEPGAFSGSIYLPNEGMKRGGVVSMDAMRMAVMNKQLRKHHG